MLMVFIARENYFKIESRLLPVGIVINVRFAAKNFILTIKQELKKFSSILQSSPILLERCKVSDSFIFHFLWFVKKFSTRTGTKNRRQMTQKYKMNENRIKDKISQKKFSEQLEKFATLVHVDIQGLNLSFAP